MTSAIVRDALREHWPAAEYLTIEEAPQDAMRQGRKIDLLVVSLWRSRGYDLDAVEIKVSLTDYRREIKDPAKAEWWFNHTSRFWVAVPSKLVDQCREDLPPTWGLLGVQSDGKVATVVKAPRHDRTELPWEALVGIMRASSGAGANALLRAEERGRSRGFEEGKRRAELESGDAHLKARIEELEAQRKAFEEASGVSFDKTGYHGSDVEAARVGRLYALLRDWSRNPEQIADRIRHASEGLVGLSKSVAKLAERIVDPEVEE